MSQQDCIDPKALERLRDLGGVPFLLQMINLFLDFTPKKLAEARAAELAGEITGIQKAIHPLRSSGGNIGCQRMADLAMRVEQLAREGRVEEIPPVLRDLESVYEEVRVRLEAERKALSA